MENIPTFYVYLFALGASFFLACFLFLPIRLFLARSKKTKLFHAVKEAEFLEPALIYQSIQKQIIELQASDPASLEHDWHYTQLVNFLTQTKLILKNDAPELDLIISALQACSSNDPQQVSALANLYHFADQALKQLKG